MPSIFRSTSKTAYFVLSLHLVGTAALRLAFNAELVPVVPTVAETRTGTPSQTDTTRRLPEISKPGSTNSDSGNRTVTKLSLTLSLPVKLTVALSSRVCDCNSDRERYFESPSSPSSTFAPDSPMIISA